MKVRDREPFLDQWLTARSVRLRRLVADTLAAIEEAENRSGTRQRKRRKSDFETRRALVETIIANLAHAAVFTRPSTAIAVSLAKRRRITRYDRPIFRQLRRTLDTLADVGVLKLRVSRQQGRASTIRPTPRFVKEVAQVDLSSQDFARHSGEEVIILSRSRLGFKTNPATLETSFGKMRERIDYPSDTRTSRRYRGEVRRINAFLEGASLTLLPNAAAPTIDTGQRRLCRHFALPDGADPNRPRFDLGGRLFGGWWQPLVKAERHRIRIEGEPIADLDFGAMYPRLAYLKAGLRPPEGDLYAVPGLEAPEYRDGVKGMMNTLLFSEGHKARIPSGFKASLPKSWTAAKVKAAILARHPDLEPILETGIGMKLMFMESQILIGVLLGLMERGIVALPMHDGIMVAVSKASQAKTVMEDVAAEETGYRLPVSEKRFEALEAV